MSHLQDTISDLKRRGAPYINAKTTSETVNNLVTYLQKRKSYQELSDLLTSSGRYDEAGVVLYQHALTLKGADERVRRIKGNLDFFWVQILLHTITR